MTNTKRKNNHRGLVIVHRIGSASHPSPRDHEPGILRRRVRCRRFVLDIPVGNAGIASQIWQVGPSRVTPCGANATNDSDAARRPDRPPVAASLPDVLADGLPIAG
jgi:hypothetical protein